MLRNNRCMHIERSPLVIYNFLLHTIMALEMLINMSFNEESRNMKILQANNIVKKT